MKKMPIFKRQKYENEDAATETVEHLIQERVPWLFLGLLGGLCTTVLLSHAEQILKTDIRLAFFIPIIVYLSDAVGSQTESIYIRAVAQKKIRFFHYLIKELGVGFALGTIFGSLVGFFASHWLHSSSLGLTLGLTIFINLTLAPILAVIIPNLIRRNHNDPALGSGPVATVIQDLVSLLIYFMVASVIIL